MELRAQLDASIAAHAEFVKRAVVTAQNRAIAAAVTRLKDRLRANAVRRGFSPAFSKAIQGVFRGTQQTGRPPEGEVFSKAVLQRGGGPIDLFRIFETAGRVKAEGGGFLVLNLTARGKAGRAASARALLRGARLIPLYRQRRGGLG